MLETLINTGGKVGYLLTLIALGFKAALALLRLIRGAPSASVSPA